MSSDQFYARQASRQRRMILLAGLGLLLLACAFAGVRNAFYDRCTASFDRGAESVAQSYLAAIRDGNASRVQDCWDHQQYYELEAGCSEICLSRLMGAQFEVIELTPGEPIEAENARQQMWVDVSARCPAGEDVSGQILLDSVSANVPWKHWRVLQSSVGGSPAQRWCEQ